MLTITTSREEAKKLATQIHEWRLKNIQGYSATSWAGENLPDKEFDALNKSVKEEKWAVAIPHDFTTTEKEVGKEVSISKSKVMSVTAISKLPADWKTVKEEVKKVK